MFRKDRKRSAEYSETDNEGNTSITKMQKRVSPKDEKRVLEQDTTEATDFSGRSVRRHKKRDVSVRSRTVPADYDDYILSKDEFKKYIIVSIFLLMSVGWLFYENLIVCAVFALLAVPYVNVYKRGLADNRRNELRLQFKDALYSMSGSVAAGRRMSEAITEALASIELIYGEDSIMAHELGYMSGQLLGTQNPDDEVLRDLASRCRVEEIVNFADVYSACRTSGGDTEKIIMKAADMIMDRMSVSRDIEVLVSQKKLESKILLVVPMAVIAVLRLISPGYLSVMYTTGVGRLIMTVSLAVLCGSYIWGNKVSQISV